MVVALVAGVGMYWADSTRSVEATQYRSTYVPATPEPREAPVVAVIGDSFTSEANGYTSQLGRMMCLQVVNLGQGGTGFATPRQNAANETNFGGRVQQAIDAAPRMVIVQGGIDAGGATATEAAARQTFAALRAGLPAVPIVAVGPTRIPDEEAEDAVDEDAEVEDAVDPDAFRDAIRTAATAEGAAFIDPIRLEWLTEPSSFVSDGAQLSAAGHARYASALVDELEEMNLPDFRRC